MDLGLTDRVIVVTGGSSGIGRAAVELLLAEGAHVATCARTEPTGFDPDRVLTMAADVLDKTAMNELVDAAVSRWGRLDGLVNNAGASRMATFGSTDDDAWRAELDLKFFGVIHVTRAAEPHLRASDVGAIVNINAVLARQPEGRLVATSAARAGALNLSKSLAEHFAPDVRLNTVLLGLIDTGQWRRRFDEAATEVTYERWGAELAENRGIKLGRLGTAEEVAPTIALLLSPRSGYTTGATIEVAGGVSRYV